MELASDDLPTDGTGGSGTVVRENIMLRGRRIFFGEPEMLSLLLSFIEDPSPVEASLVLELPVVVEIELGGVVSPSRVEASSLLLGDSDREVEGELAGFLPLTTTVSELARGSCGENLSAFDNATDPSVTLVGGRNVETVILGFSLEKLDLMDVLLTMAGCVTFRTVGSSVSGIGGEDPMVSVA